MIRFSRALVTLVVAFFAPAALAQLTVQSTSPALNASNVARNATISITFDRVVNPGTFTGANFRAFGKLTGPVSGTVSFTNGTRTVQFTPVRPFLPGEIVMVVLSHNIRGADGSFLRQAGYTLTFTTQAAASHHVFRQKAVISNRTNNGTGPQTRIYGAITCDLNHDGWSDLTTVNEVSEDLRVFLNRADGSGLMQPMLQPFTPVPNESSPNEVGDFDGDGHIDAVVSSYTTAQVAVCFGNGNGTFRTPLLINVGNVARGFGIMDADGDGDMDIAVACTDSNAVFYIQNLGLGSFAPPVSIPVVGGPYGMMAADMNNDGILDLVVGCRNDQTCKVLRGNGDGTFSLVSTRAIGGANWVLMLADLNNDRTIDVSAANSGSANGSILLGNGDLTLQAAQVMPTGGHTASTDLADLDGDGDQDWILSAFGAGLWYVYLNDGTGHFTPLTQVSAPANPSCAAPVDLDNDGDIDLVLTDEIADVMVLLLNVCPSDFDDGTGTGSPDGGVTIDDLLYYLSIFDLGNIAADVDDGSGTGTPDGGVTIDDLLYFLFRFDIGC